MKSEIDRIVLISVEGSDINGYWYTFMSSNEPDKRYRATQDQIVADDQFGPYDHGCFILRSELDNMFVLERIPKSEYTSVCKTRISPE